jgi:metacaspase-1
MLFFQYSTEGKVKEPNLAAEAGHGVMSAVTSYAKGDMGGVFKSVTGLIKTASGNTQKAEEYARATRTSPADVVCSPRIVFGLNGGDDHFCCCLDLVEWM